MGLEEKVFERKKPDFEKLAEFGFQKDKEGYHYSQLFMDGDFRADISISLERNVFGRVFDTAAGEEYLPVHVPYQTGGLCEYGQGPLCGNIGNDRRWMLY